MVSKTLTKQIDRLLLVLGLSLMLGLMLLGPSFKIAVGQIVGTLIDPILIIFGQQKFDLLILVMAVIASTYASIILKYKSDWKRKIEVQSRMKEFQAEFREAQLSQNTYMLKKLEDQRKDMMTEQMEQSKNEFKNMFYISIASIQIYWIYYYGSGHELASMVFPFWGKQLLFSPFCFFFWRLWYLPYWGYWYLLCSIGIGTIIRKRLVDGHF